MFFPPAAVVCWWFHGQSVNQIVSQSANQIGRSTNRGQASHKSPVAVVCWWFRGQSALVSPGTSCVASCPAVVSLDRRWWSCFLPVEGGLRGWVERACWEGGLRGCMRMCKGLNRVGSVTRKERMRKERMSVVSCLLSSSVCVGCPSPLL